jgi:hypothetical protein
MNHRGTELTKIKPAPLAVSGFISKQPDAARYITRIDFLSALSAFAVTGFAILDGG